MICFNIFQGHDLCTNLSPDQVVQVSRLRFTDDRAKTVHHDICMDLSFDLVKLSRLSENLETTYQKVLSSITTRISGLAYTRTPVRRTVEVMAKKIVAIRGEEHFAPSCRNHSKEKVELDSAFRSFAPE